MGTNAWNTFVLRVEHPYIVGKSEKVGEIASMCEPTFHAEKTACHRLQQQTTVHALVLAPQTTLETAWKQTISLSITSSDC